MDSGNSGSMQSSSGGDEEYDSRRADPIPTNFFSNPSSNYHHHHHHPISTPPSSLFNNNPPSSNYLDAFSSQSQANPNSLLNLDVVWSRGLQLDHPNYTTLVGNLTAAGSSTTTTTTTATSSSQSILIGSQGQGGRGQGVYPSSSSAMLRPVHENGSGIVKNPKKRTRASRRAPTTVLTTDTSNFRAMVQEFTGIPAPPFSAASSYSRRLDLFGTGAAAMRSGTGTGHSEPSLGSSFLYPLRPSAQKIHQFTPSLVSSSPLFLNSSIVDTSTTTSNNANLNSNPGKYQADDQDILMNMQNDQMLTFQSLMQQQPPSNFPTQLKYSLADEAAVFGMKTQGQSQLEELRMSHGNVNANNANINVHTSWGSNNNHSHEKGLEMINNVSSRGGEGTVDSWICPSD